MFHYIDIPVSISIQPPANTGCFYLSYYDNSAVHVGMQTLTHPLDVHPNLLLYVLHDISSMA